MTATIDPGRLRSRLELEVPVETPDGQGGYSLSWQKQADIWAAIGATGAGAREAAGSRQTVTAYEIVLRTRSDVLPGCRFRLGARLLEIDAVFDPDQTGRYLTCRCRESR